MVTIEENRRVVAEESERTKKAREKIQGQMERISARITPESLQKKSAEIQDWIARHSNIRETLKDKSITLFAENQNSASYSSRIDQIRKELGENLKDIFSPCQDVASENLAGKEKIE
jgi:predicted DNA-binding helix-hairpin-helix protein